MVWHGMFINCTSGTVKTQTHTMQIDKQNVIKHNMLQGTSKLPSQSVLYNIFHLICSVKSKYLKCN